MNSSLELAAIPFTATVIFPLIASTGTVAVRVVLVASVTTAITPLNFTKLADGFVLKFKPVIVTELPTGPEVGENPLTVGAGPSVPFLQEKRQEIKAVTINNRKKACCITFIEVGCYRYGSF